MNSVTNPTILYALQAIRSMRCCKDERSFMVSSKYEVMSVDSFFCCCLTLTCVNVCSKQATSLYLHTSKIRCLINFELTVNFLINSTTEYTAQVK